ncbi:hypothetical protein BJX99DRAFT_258554 [Aspergillus californicus]
MNQTLIPNRTSIPSQAGAGTEIIKTMITALQDLSSFTWEKEQVIDGLQLQSIQQAAVTKSLEEQLAVKDLQLQVFRSSRMGQSDKRLEKIETEMKETREKQMKERQEDREKVAELLSGLSKGFMVRFGKDGE